MTRAAIYVHIPFCAAKCAYCDFASFSGRERDAARYLCALEDEMRASAAEFGRLRAGSLYLGGGTPSLLTGPQMAGLLDAARGCFDWTQDIEVTAEANPGTLDAAKLAHYRRAGINRLSVGVQSFDNRLLSVLGRVHDGGQALCALRAAADAGFDNLSADLMYGLPGQTARDVLESIDRALENGVRHLSLYCLTLEPGTPMAALADRGRLALPDADAAAEQQEVAERALAAAGLARYEISNYAAPGFESRHNLVYWRRGDYLGLGCAAHSMMNGTRFFNTSSLDEYLAGSRRASSRALTADEARGEELMLRLRLAEGIDLADFLRGYGVDLWAEKGDVIAGLVDGGLARLEDGRLALTSRGLNLQSAVLMRLM
ncbi:MAG: radical SAM family heme chaperone HemW [Clostridiales bacterium]|nr:radical SAM family heme chaperone HemW [Clostridiales bacterium]